MPGKVLLPADLQQQMIDLALANPDREACGLAGGLDNELHSFYPVTNIDPDPRYAFLLEPREQIAVMRQMRERDEELRGIFHSHPDGTAEPSSTDLLLAAYPGVYYFIVSLQSSPPELCAWYFDGNEFTETEISLVN